MKFLLSAIVISMSLQAAVTQTFELPRVPKMPDGAEFPSNLVLPKPPVPPTTGSTYSPSSSQETTSEPETDPSSPSTDSKSEDFTYNLGPGRNISFEGLSEYGITFKVRDTPGQKSDADTNSESTSTSTTSAPPETDPATATTTTTTTSSAAPDATTPTA